jgi:hypothetical protein
MIKNIFFSALCAAPIFLHANLRPVHLSVEIDAPRTKFTNSEIVQINVRLKNTDFKAHSILVPGNQSTGKKLIYFTWHKVEANGLYTEIFRDSRTIAMDTNVKGYVHFKRLEAGAEITIPFFLNDLKNAKNHILSTYEIPKLAPGKYKIIAWYFPWDEELAKYAFNQYDWEGNDSFEEENSERLKLPDTGTQSAYFDVEIVAENSEIATKTYSKSCPKKCHLCRAIQHNQWGKVERIIRRQSSARSRFKRKGKNYGNWHKNHRNVAYYGPYPDAIQASFPGNTGIEIIFRNQKGYHYYYLNWQIGKTYRVFSRLNWFTHWAFRIQAPFRSSNRHYYVLKKLKSW